MAGTDGQPCRGGQHLPPAATHGPHTITQRLRIQAASLRRMADEAPPQIAYAINCTADALDDCAADLERLEREPRVTTEYRWATST